jgi:acetyltransferase-like isoleucine patch superfamily enzyme
MLHFFSMLKYPFLNGVFLPFKVYTVAGIKIRPGADVKMSGRVVLGNEDAALPVVSRLPVNIYFGKQSKVVLGRSINIGAGVNIIVKDDAALSIGDNTYFTSDAHIETVNFITIGADCAISWGVTIIDDDHHVTCSPGQEPVKRKTSVIIGNKVWIGCNVTILKDTVIGNNCIIGANSLVKGQFPDNCLIAGNPAKIIKQPVEWK